jgi:hypothetical protein
MQMLCYMWSIFCIIPSVCMHCTLIKQRVVVLGVSEATDMLRLATLKNIATAGDVVLFGVWRHTASIFMRAAVLLAS